MQPVHIQAETSCFIDQSLLKNANKFNAASKKLNCLQLMVLRLNIFFVSTLAVYQHVPMSDVTGQ